MCFLCPRLKGRNRKEEGELPVRLVIMKPNSNTVNRISPPPSRVTTPRAASIHSKPETPFGLKVLFSGHDPIVEYDNPKEYDEYTNIDPMYGLQCDRGAWT
jgi:hypothetical protein